MTLRASRLAVRLGLFTTTLLASAPALAQVVPTLPPNAGQVLRDNRQTTPEMPTTKPAPLLSVPDEKDPASDPSQRLTVSAIRIEGAVSLPVSDLQPLVADLVGKDISLGDLRAGVRRITTYYRERGYVVARAFIPAQEIDGGVLRVQILEGKLVSSRAVNGTRVNSHVLQSVLDAQKLNGKVIASSTTDRGLLLLADLPSVGKVAGKLRPGAEVGTSDLVVSVDKGKTYEGQVSLDTYGNRYTGVNRVSAQGSWNSPAGLGDRLSGQLTLTDEQLAYGRLAYDLPIGGNGLRAGGAVSVSSYQLGQEFASLDATGTAKTASLYAAYPVVRGLNRNVWLTGNVEYRKLVDEIASVSSKTEKSATVGTLEAYGDMVDAVLRGGYSTWRVSATAGDLSIDTPAALIIDQGGPKTNGRYEKLVFSASRLQAITSKTSASIVVSGQLASKNLDSSEKFVIGGVYGVRAYPQGEGAGDNGWLVNAELRHAVTPDLQLAAFYDAGHVDFNESPYAAGKKGVDLRGYGVSAAASRGPLSGKVILAWRGNTDPATTAPDRSPRVWVSLGYRF